MAIRTQSSLWPTSSRTRWCPSLLERVAARLHFHASPKQMGGNQLAQAEEGVTEIDVEFVAGHLEGDVQSLRSRESAVDTFSSMLHTSFQGNVTYGENR